MSDEAVFEMHELLDLMLRTCVREGRVLMLGSDFDACIGFAEGYDQVDFIIVKVKVKSQSHWCFFLVFFFRAPFSRSRSLVKDCFTGQSPGKAICIPAAPDVQRSQTKSKP